MAFSKLVYTALLSLILQIAVGVPSAIAQSEMLFDVTGSVTFVCCTIFSFFSGTRYHSVRATILSGMVAGWAARLGSFLFARIGACDGKDSRFEAIRSNPTRFLVVWFIQAVWVTVVGLPAYTVNVAGIDPPPALGLCDLLAIALWVAGFATEVVADYQKGAAGAAHRSAAAAAKAAGKPAPRRMPVTHGLWSLSRHPNYAGEITLWAGAWLLSASELGWGYTFLSALSPVLATLLLLRVSGIPLLEAKADAEYKDLSAYKEYKAKTAVLFPFIY